MTPKPAGKTRVAVVGAGFIADNHLQALSELTWVEVVAICDPKQSAAEALGRKWKVRTLCSDVDELATLDPKPHVAHLLAPPALHEKLIDKLLDHGISVFAEKPMALDSKTCDRLAKKAADKDLTLGVNHNMCFHPAIVELLGEIEAGTIGTVQFVSSILNLPLRQLAMRQFGHWMFQEPQNILLETGCHPYSVIHAILGECYDARTRIGEQVELPGNKVFYKSWRTLLDCERGQAMSYMSMGREYLSSRVFVIGTDGSLDADLATGSVMRGRKTRFPEFWDIASNELDDAKRKRRNARKAFFDYTLALAKIRPRNDPFYATMKGSVRAFHEDFRDGVEPRMGAEEGKAAVVYCEKIWEGREDTVSSAKGGSGSKPSGKQKHKHGKKGKKHKKTHATPIEAPDTANGSVDGAPAFTP
ncbi:MAG: Gfo/Idh/MocA family oxidoreductase, partial [Planctomycetes bacterium]|nr:Gfo/Idh/MocA family oxidoreductase [Planctomycetota bacterium]